MTASVSVVMPARNCEAYIDEAITSILNQTMTSWELLVIENGSSDRTAEIAHRLAEGESRIRVVEAGDIGLVRALNLGLEMASYDYVARMDADDISHPTRLERQLAYLETHPDCGLLGTAYRYVDADGNHIGVRRVLRSDPMIRAEFNFGNPLGHPTIMFARDRLKPAPVYVADFKDAEDFELWLRLAPSTSLANLPAVLLDHRVHPGTVTSKDGNLGRDNSLRALAVLEGDEAVARVHRYTFNPSLQVGAREFLRAIAQLNTRPGGGSIHERSALAIRSAVAVARFGRNSLRRRRGPG